MKLYLTEYRAASGNMFESWIVAEDWWDASAKADARRMGETLTGWQDERGEMQIRASHTLRGGHTLAAESHALTYLMHLAIPSGAAFLYDFVDDTQGVLHQWLHLEMGADQTHPMSRDEVIAKVEAIERAIPGYLAPGER